MFQDLDDTLKKMLDDPAAPQVLRDADVSFETPEKGFVVGQATINLFLYEVRENRELRDPLPITKLKGGVYVRQPATLRVECCSLVPAWSHEEKAKKVAEEHQLLALALVWLSRFATIPASFFQGSLVGQPFPPPTLVAQLNSDKNMGEFWTALGSAPRPAFYLTATLALDLNVEAPDGPPVVTKEIILNGESLLEIAGLVTAAATDAPIEGAQVLLLEKQRTTMTDVQGRFRFNNLTAGNYTLRVSAAGFVTADNPITVPGTTLDEYDVSLTP
jgi:hypothetical protein